MFNNKYSLDNKKILVTGASSGIGRETAILLSNLGATLVISGRHEDRLKETLNGLNDPAKHSVFVGDLADDATLDELVKSIDSLDGLALSAGIVKTVPFKFLKREDLQNIMKINFESPVMLCQKLLKNKKIKKEGAIVFVSSLAGINRVDAGNGAYCASKNALNAACKAIGLEVAPQKIRANCVCPGMVWTPLTQQELTSITPEQLEAHQKLYPLGYGNPEDVAYSIAYLLSDASRWVTGTTMIIDGGFSIN